MSEFESAEYGNTESAKVEREGLPPGYRMRADAHYVEALSGTPRSDRARDAARAPASEDAPRHAAQDRRLLDQLTDDVAAIESAAVMLTAERSPLVRRVGLDLIKAQAARAAWLLRANTIAGSADGDAHLSRRRLADILADVRKRASVECRLLGVGLEVETSADAAEVNLADALLSAGITGAVMAQLGLVDGVEGAVIRVRASVVPAEMSAISIEIVQDAAPAPGGSSAKFFDAGWVTRPGGWLAAMGAATAKAAAERLGGSVAVVTTERRGCALRLTLP